MLSGRGLCDELITRQEESYRLWCVVVCDLETSRMRRPWAALGRSATGGGGKCNQNEQQQGAQDSAELQMIRVKKTWKSFEEAIRRGRNMCVKG